MLKHIVEVLTIILLLVIIGCAFGISLPGTGGRSSVQKIETGHTDVPEGVNCYVCHKTDRPDNEFHNKFSVACEDCHEKTTWMAYKYPHEAWDLGIHRNMPCYRCHPQMEVYDFSVWQCFGCHHDEKEMIESHKKLNIDNVSNCIGCHT